MSERRALFGAVALSAVNAGRIGLQLLILPLLARLLGPEAFGLVGLAMPFIFLANMLCDAGMGAALVRQASPTRELESTVFWLSLGMGGLLALAVSAASLPIAIVFDHRELAPVLAALSVILVLSGGVAVSNARIARSRNFSLFAIAEFMAALVSAAAGVTAAFLGLGVWSLVIQQISLWLVKAAWLIPASGFRPAFSCRPSLAMPFVRFGLNAVGANIAEFISKNIPPLVVGGAFGVNGLGHYTMAVQLTRAPEMVIAGPVYLSTFTAVARVASDQAQARRLVLDGLGMLVMALSPLFCGLAIVADLATSVILGPKWVATAPLLAALCGAGFFLCLYSYFAATFLGLGQSGRSFRLTLLCGVGMTLGAVLGAQHSLNGVAVGVSLGAAAAAPFYARGLAQELRVSGGAVATTLAGPLVAVLLMIAAVLLVRSKLDHQSDAAQLAICVAVGIAAYAAALATTRGRRVLEDIRRMRPATGA